MVKFNSYFKQFLAIVLAVVISNEVVDAKMCATLFKEGGYQGASYSMSEDFLVTDFEEQYTNATADSMWNSTLSFTVSNRCEIKVCNETHFNGHCSKFSKSLDQLPDGFNNILSAECFCTRNCSCEDIMLRGKSCARAYLGENGCNECNPSYTDLRGVVPAFPSEFETKVKAIKVREGCSLSLTVFDPEYAYSDFVDDEETIVTGTVEFWNGIIKSYNCSCPNEDLLLKKKPLRPSNYPVLIDVPKSIENVSIMLTGRFRRHPGLLAALTSLKNKRSSKNVYILTIGSTGAGKSSAINLLFDNPYITKVGGTESTTTDIHEFRISVPVDELGIQNSELRVIDTPGLGDTRGLEQDAKYLATLDDYFSNHEELKDRIPNVVLIFHKFNDNRFNGEGSNFVKMLKGLDAFRTRITDENYSNVIFVLSHFTSELKDIVKKPKARLLKFKEVIELNTLFPKPVVIAVAENQAARQGLPSVNGYFKLPNGDYYPRNLFEKIDAATLAGGDPIGNAVIRTAFRDSNDFNVSSVTHKLVEFEDKKVSKYLQILSDAIFNVNKTEISQMLNETYENMNSTLKKRFHGSSLLVLQKALNLRNIRTKSDIPQTTQGILELLSCLPKSEATTFLLEKGLNLTAPVFNEKVVAGYSYNVFKDIPLHKSPFELGESINSDIGYLLPSAMTCSKKGQVSDFVRIFETRKEYLDWRLTSLGIQGKIPENEFSGKIKTGFNIKKESYLNDSCKITAVREFRNFELVLNDKPKLTTEFQAVLLSLPVFNETDNVTVKIWNDFFDEYGTHVVKTVYGGGAVEIYVESNKACDMDTAKTLFDWIQLAEDLNIGNDNSSALLQRKGVQHKLKFRGGDQAYHTTDLTNMTLDDASRLFSNWKKSLSLNPTILTSEIQLLPISIVARKVGQKSNVTAEIERATTLRFNSTLKWIPPKNIPGPSRDDTKPNANPAKDIGKDVAKTAGGGCLRRGTQILLADKTSKLVENIQVGDVILDHKMKPTKVIGISYEFLREQSFYGFDNGSFFFTSGHIMVGPRPHKEIQLYVKDLKSSLDENPLAQFLNVREMKSSKSLKMYMLEKSNSSLSSRNVDIFKDPEAYPSNTLVYFLLVDSPSGTYFANGYVCHHGIPPITIWPNTVALLFRLYSTLHPTFKLLEEVPFTMETSATLKNIVAEVQSNVQTTLYFLDSDIEDLKKNEPKFELDNMNVEQSISILFKHPTVGFLTRAIYAATSKTIAEYLDTNNRDLEPYIGSMQKVIIESMARQITSSCYDYIPQLQ